jgi:hypothetical protein
MSFIAKKNKFVFAFVEKFIDAGFKNGRKTVNSKINKIVK